MLSFIRKWIFVKSFVFLLFVVLAERAGARLLFSSTGVKAALAPSPATYIKVCAG